MSRRDLINAANRVGVKTDAVRGGKRGAKDNNWLRMDLLEGTYGVGMHWQFKTAAEADLTCTRAVDCFTGKLGYWLSVSQMALRNSTKEIAEARRLAGLKRDHMSKRVELLSSARRWQEVCRRAHNMYEHERACARRVR